MEKMSDKTKIQIIRMIGIVNNPTLFNEIVNACGAFDAAEFLYNNHWEEVNVNTKDKIVNILLESGHYEVAE